MVTIKVFLQSVIVPLMAQNDFEVRDAESSLPKDKGNIANSQKICYCSKHCKFPKSFTNLAHLL